MSQRMKNEQWPTQLETKETKLFKKAFQQYVESDRMFYFIGRDFAYTADSTMHERLSQFVTGYNDAVDWLNNE